MFSLNALLRFVCGFLYGAVCVVCVCLCVALSFNVCVFCLRCIAMFYGL